jgi:hypothetical protein
MNSRCLKCGLPIHTERIISAKAHKTEWLHDDYKTAWQVDEEGHAHNLHFAVWEIQPLE